MNENSKTPILFLDFDGVVLSQADSENWIDEFGPAFDADKIAYIHALQQETACRIVIISSWRNRAEGGIAAMQRMMRDRGIDLAITDTVLLDSDPRAAGLCNRSSFIDFWMAENHNGEPIAIIDDSMRDGFFSPHHYNVHIQPHWSGMTEKDYLSAKNLLLNKSALAFKDAKSFLPRSLSPN